MISELNCNSNPKLCHCINYICYGNTKPTINPQQDSAAATLKIRNNIVPSLWWLQANYKLASCSYWTAISSFWS